MKLPFLIILNHGIYYSISTNEAAFLASKNRPPFYVTNNFNPYPVNNKLRFFWDVKCTLPYPFRDYLMALLRCDPHEVVNFWIDERDGVPHMFIGRKE